MRKKVSIFVFVAVVALALLWFVQSYVFAVYEYEDARVEIGRGASDEEVSEAFNERLGRRFGSKVYALWKLQGGTVAGSHGSYKVSRGDDAFRVARRVAKGRQTPVRVTFNNIRLMGDFARKVSEYIEADSATVMKAVESVLPNEGYSRENYPSAFLPNTYEVYWTSDAMTVVEKMTSYRDAFWTPERKRRAKALGLTPEQVHTLASIVEEETVRADERPVVARLYLNRLSKGMALQADPTVKYAMGDFGIRRITRDMLDVNSRYNTYRYEGLPPGPIRIVDGRSIDAVLEAPEHDYLYMCAKSDFSGYHEFAETYDRHRLNAARYHSALDRRGIK